MAKTEQIETYIFFTCPGCDEEGKTRMAFEEFKKHISEVHGITDTHGTRELSMHVDASRWFSYVWKWTIGGTVFMQHTKQARKHSFG